MLMPIPYIIGGFTPDFTITAATFSTSIGWLDGSFGSVTGDTSYDGTNISAVYWESVEGENFVVFLGSPTAPSTITIDGTDYSLTFFDTERGNDRYIFGPGSSLFVDSVDYGITLE